MDHAIVTQKRLSQYRRIRPSRRDTNGRSPQVVALLSASYIQWYLPPSVPRDEPKYSRANGRGKAQENHRAYDNESHTRVLPTGDVAPQEVFQNNPRTPPASPRHGDEAVSQGLIRQLCCYNPMPCTTSVLEHVGETTPPSHQLPTPTSQAGWSASPSASLTAQTKKRTHTIRGAKGGSMSSLLWYTIRWIMMIRSSWTRNFQVSITPFLGTPNS